MPTAWDRTASGPSSCTTTLSDRAKVYAYLNAQALRLNSYVGSPLWGVVDGPWKLSAFNADGHITFVPNKSYSGPVKPKLAEFQEVPFTTDTAEYDVLQSGSSGSQKVDVGYIPAEDVPPKPAGHAAGANPQSPTLSINPEDWYFVKQGRRGCGLIPTSLARAARPAPVGRCPRK
jgi:peptide/nickel transport system substrate-binding protein